MSLFTILSGPDHNPLGQRRADISGYDTMVDVEAPVIEDHLSSIHGREDFRQHSHLSTRADGVIAGLGVEGHAMSFPHLIGLWTR